MVVSPSALPHLPVFRPAAQRHARAGGGSAGGGAAGAPEFHVFAHQPVCCDLLCHHCSLTRQLLQCMMLTMPTLRRVRVGRSCAQLQRMDMEARSYSPDQARQLLQKVKEYKADLAALKEKSRRAAAGAGGGPEARAELGLAGDYFQTSAGQRDRLLTATDRLNKTSDRIQQGRQQLHETEVRRQQGLLGARLCG